MGWFSLYLFIAGLNLFALGFGLAAEVPVGLSILNGLCVAFGLWCAVDEIEPKNKPKEKAVSRARHRAL